MQRYLALLVSPTPGFDAGVGKGRLHWRSMTTAVVTVRRGKHHNDRAVIKFDVKTGEVTVTAKGLEQKDIEPDASVAEAIKTAILERPIKLP